MEDISVLAAWRHKDKGGIYEVDLIAKGAGDSRGEEMAVYWCVNNCQHYVRNKSEWHDKMEKIQEG